MSEMPWLLRQVREWSLLPRHGESLHKAAVTCQGSEYVRLTLTAAREFAHLSQEPIKPCGVTMAVQIQGSVVTTYPDGREHIAPAFPRNCIAYMDVFQRACSGYHTLTHISWTLAHIGHADLVCAPALDGVRK